MSSWRPLSASSSPRFDPKALLVQEQYAVALEVDKQMSKHVALGVCAGVLAFGCVIALAASAPARPSQVQAHKGPRTVTRAALVEATIQTFCAPPTSDTSAGACVMTANGLVSDLRVDTGDFVKLLDVVREQERAEKPGKKTVKPRPSLLCGAVICAPMFASVD
jgi:hypothetical protein